MNENHYCLPSNTHLRFRCIDGGIGNAVPSFEGAVTVCPVPGTGVTAHPLNPARLIASDVHITPDLLGTDWILPNYAVLLRHALIPGTEEELWGYFELGAESAKAWCSATSSADDRASK